MKRTTIYIVIAGALLFGFVCGQLQAQTSSETAEKVKRVLAVPIKVIGAQIREIPSSFLHKPAKGEETRTIEVLDLSVEARSRDLETFPPSLQPLLYIGGKAFPAQRTEYSNWDARKEKPMDEKAPVGETQTVHFFIEDWQKLELGQPMVLSILTPEEIKKETGGQFTVEQFKRIMPELKSMIPRYVPKEFMKMGQDK